MVIMKRYVLLFVALAALMVGCSNENEGVKRSIDIVGGWHCTPEEFDADIYVDFIEDGSFDLYQRVGQGRSRHYAGTWTVERNILSGSYADGTPWGSSYSVAKLDDSSISLTAQNGSMEVMVYRKEAIPDNVKQESVDVRSTQCDELDVVERPL